MKNIILLLLFVQCVFGQFTPFHMTKSGNIMNGGSDASDAAKVTMVNGNWNSGTGVFIGPATDLSTVTTNDYASVFLDGTTNWPVYIARVSAINDGTDTITVTTAASRVGTPPTTGATGISIKVGGAWHGHTGTNFFPFRIVNNDLTLAHLSTSLSNGLGNAVKLWVKGTGDGTVDYEISAPFTNFSPGVLFVEGYTNTVGDGGLARLHGGTNGALTLYGPWTMSGLGLTEWRYLHFSGGGTSGTPAIGTNFMANFTTTVRLYRCLFTDSWRTGCKIGGAGNQIIESSAIGCNFDAASGRAGFEVSGISTFYRCFSGYHQFRDGDNGCVGFFYSGSVSTPVTFDECVSAFNWGTGFEQTGNTANIVFRSCIAYSNRLYGINIPVSVAGATNTSYVDIENSIFAYNHTGIRGGDPIPQWGPRVVTNAFYSNTNGAVTFISTNTQLGSITLTGDPFTAPGTGNFALNNTAGAGASVRGILRYPWQQNSTNMSTRTASYADVGPAQHQDAGGAAAGGSFTFVQ